jgi:ribosomal protein L11 methyltransferase
VSQGPITLGVRTLKWLEICVAVQSEEAVKTVCQLFDLHGQGGAVQEQLFSRQGQAGAGVPGALTVKTYLSLDGGDEHRLQTLQNELARLAHLGQIPPALFKELEERDWATAWKAFFQPQRIGRRLVLKLPEQVFPAAEDDIVIDLEPGMAFGTGLHATTRMCLVCLEELVKAGDTLLDMGTGSGVLAIAAAKLGAKSVLALDNDSTAVEVARENTLRNSATDAVRVEEGTLEYLAHHPMPPLDGMAINIIAEIIVQMMKDGLASHLKPGGWLVASGILASSEAQVRAVFDTCEVQVADRSQQEEWVTLCGTKRRSNRPRHPGGGWS